MIRLEVTARASSRAGSRHESTADVVRIGRAEGNDLVLPDEHVSGEHARIVLGGERLRAARPALDQRHGRRPRRASASRSTTRNGREIALADGRRHRARRAATASCASRSRSPRTTRRRRASSRCARSTSSARAESTVERDGEPPARPLRRAEAHRRAPSDLARGARRDLRRRASTLVPGATHVTVVLRDDDEEPRAASAAGYVPDHDARARAAGRRRRSPSRSRAASSARSSASAPPSSRPTRRARSAQTESLMGAQIRSDARRAALEGRRDPRRPADRQPREHRRLHERATSTSCAVLAHHASLAVANARLVQRLRAAEERLKKENAFLKSARGVAARRQGRAGDHRAEPRR